MDQGVPLDALVLQRLTDQRQVGGLVVVRHRRVCHRRRGITAGVERNQMLADGVFHNGGNHMVMLQHCFAGKSAACFLVLPRLEQHGVEIVQHIAGDFVHRRLA